MNEPNMGQGAEIPDEVRDEAVRRIRDGESPHSVAEDLDDISKSTAYRLEKEIDEWEDENQELEASVFQGGKRVTADDFEDVFHDLGVGVTVDGNLKKKVQRAVSAIEMENATEDPYLARDILYDESEMTWKWANRIVRAVFDLPNFPHQSGQQEGQRPPHGYGRRAGGSEPPPGYGRRAQGAGGGGGYGPPPGQGGGRQGVQEPQPPAWAEDIREQQEQVAESLAAVAEAIQDDSSDQSDAPMVQIEQPTGDGDTRTLKVPANSPQAYELLGQQEERGMLETLRAAKDVGLIPDPQAQGSATADAIEEGLESMAQAQETMSANLQNAIREVRQLAETSEDKQLTPEEVDEILEEKLSQAERDQLRKEIQNLREEVRNQDSELIHLSGEDSPLMKDKDVLSKHVERQSEKDQLQTVQHAGDRMIEQGLPELRKGLQELVGMMRYGQAPPGPGAPGQGNAPMSIGPEEAGSQSQGGLPGEAPEGGGEPAAEAAPTDQEIEQEAESVWESLTEAEGGA